MQNRIRVKGYLFHSIGALALFTALWACGLPFAPAINRTRWLLPFGCLVWWASLPVAIGLQIRSYSLRVPSIKRWRNVLCGVWVWCASVISIYLWMFFTWFSG